MTRATNPHRLCPYGFEFSSHRCLFAAEALKWRGRRGSQDPAQPFTIEWKFMMERILIEMGENDGENEHGLLIPTFHTVLVVRREGSSHLVSLKLVL